MQYDYIIELLSFQDKDIIVDDIKSQENNVFVFIHKDKSLSVNCCKYCGSLNFISHGFYNRVIKYGTYFFKNIYIIFHQRRFICKDCHKTFNESTKLVDASKNISNTVILNILERSRKKISFKDVSEENNVSDATIYNEFKKHEGSFRCKLTEIICIDEFKASTIAGEYALIIGDPVSGKILDILPSRKQDYIYYYFQTIPDEERFNIKYVVTDLFEPYKTICDNLFWKSIHIADRFHWIKQCTEAFNKTRIKIMNDYLSLGKDEFKGSYNKYTQYAQILKKYWKFFVANPYSKEPFFYDQKIIVSYIRREMTVQELIEWCCNQDKELSESYEELMDLYKIAKYSNYDTAHDDLLEWIKHVEEINMKIPNMKKVAATYRHWLKPIVNSFIIDPTTKSKLTNGFIEGKNNFCKTIKRIGFGYKNFDTFRAKILYTNDPDKPFKN